MGFDTHIPSITEDLILDDGHEWTPDSVLGKPSQPGSSLPSRTGGVYHHYGFVYISTLLCFSVLVSTALYAFKGVTKR